MATGSRGDGRVVSMGKCALILVGVKDYRARGSFVRVFGYSLTLMRAYNIIT